MNAPVKIQPRASALELLHLVESLESLDRSPASILQTMEIEGAYSRFSGGAYFIRYRGVVGSSTAGGKALVDAWTRAARRKFKLGEFA